MDTIISNVYIKIPDSSVSLQSILNEVAGKIGEPPTDLILLDSTVAVNINFTFRIR